MSTEVVETSDSSLVPKTFRDTLKEVLEDETINATFGGRDGKLSPTQAGLASAVTVKMQDRLREQAQVAHQRELRLIGGFWKLYRTPVLSLGVSDRTESPGTISSSQPRTLIGFFTWGNFLGGAALIITAVALWYTSVSSNYKSLWETSEAEKKSLFEKLQSSQKAAEDQAADWGKAVARADALEESNKQLTANQKEMGAELRKQIEAVGKSKGELARQTAMASSEKTYERLYAKAVHELEKLRRESAEPPKASAPSR